MDEDHFDNTDLGKLEYGTIEDYIESKVWFEKLMKKPHKTEKFKEPIGDVIESYAFEKGKVWIGEITKLLGIFNKDVVEDFTKDYHEMLEDKKEIKLINKSIGSIAMELVKEKIKST